MSDAERFNPYHRGPGKGVGEFASHGNAGGSKGTKPSAAAYATHSGYNAAHASAKKQALLKQAHADLEEAHRLEIQLRALLKQQAHAHAAAKHAAAAAKAAKKAGHVTHHRKHTAAHHKHTTHAKSLTSRISGLRSRIHHLRLQAAQLEHQASAMRTANTAEASTVHEPVGKPGGPGLWHHKGLQLPAYIQHVANELRKQGHDESRAVEMAVGIVKNWAAGHDGHGNRVHPDVQAAAAKNIAQWDALKASHNSAKRTAATRRWRDAWRTSQEVGGGR